MVALCNSQDFDVSVIGRLLLESEWQSDRRPIEAKISRQIYDSCVGQYKNSQRQAIGAHYQHGIGIRREGDRIFTQATGSRPRPGNERELLPPIAGQLLPESKTHFFERLSGMPLTFSRDARGKVTGLTVPYQGKVFSYEKISDQPPKAPEPPHRPVSIKLDTKLLDVCAGHYEFTPKALFPTGMKLTIWREGDHLVGQAWGEKVPTGIFDIYPESETNFFPKTIDWLQLTFIKNDKGEVTSVINHYPGFQDCEEKKLK